MKTNESEWGKYLAGKISTIQKYTPEYREWYAKVREKQMNRELVRPCTREKQIFECEFAQEQRVEQVRLKKWNGKCFFCGKKKHCLYDKKAKVFECKSCGYKNLSPEEKTSWNQVTVSFSLLGSTTKPALINFLKQEK